MQGFEDVTLSWKGEEYVVPARRMLELVAQLEDILCDWSRPSAIAVLVNPHGVPPAKLARAFGAALRFAGARVKDDDLYLSLQAELLSQNTEAQAAMQGAIHALIAMISPPTAMRLREFADKAEAPAEGEAEKKT